MDSVAARCTSRDNGPSVSVIWAGAGGLLPMDDLEAWTEGVSQDWLVSDTVSD